MMAEHESGRYARELTAATERAVGGSLPPHLKDITHEHLVRLEALVASMRSAGVGEDLVRHSVREIIASYEACLVEVMVTMSREER